MEKKITEMTNKELVEEIRYLASLLDDQPHQAGWLAEVAEELSRRVWAD